MIIEDVTRGIFIKEENNRFRCLVKIKKAIVSCYVPSSCKLSHFINLKGRTVLLKRTKNSKTGINFSLFAVKIKNSFVLLNLALANKIIIEQIGKRCFSFLGKRKSIDWEKTIEGYKSDIFLKETNTIVEIKTIISTNNTASFPSVLSNRILRQLILINNLIDKGYKCCLLIAVLSPSVRFITIHKDYQQLIEKCIEKGLILHACRIVTNSVEINVQGKIKIKMGKTEETIS